MLVCQYLILPPWSPVIIQLSLWLHTIVLTAVSWACSSTVTNYKQFHRRRRVKEGEKRKNLQDCLKVECESIPECEFSTGRTSDESSAFWCPLNRRSIMKRGERTRRTYCDDINWTSNFVCRGVNELCTDTCNWIIQHRSRRQQLSFGQLLCLLLQQNVHLWCIQRWVEVHNNLWSLVDTVWPKKRNVRDMWTKDLPAFNKMTNLRDTEPQMHIWYPHVQRTGTFRSSLYNLSHNWRQRNKIKKKILPPRVSNSWHCSPLSFVELVFSSVCHQRPSSVEEQEEAEDSHALLGLVHNCTWLLSCNSCFRAFLEMYRHCQIDQERFFTSQFQLLQMNFVMLSSSSAHQLQSSATAKKWW